MGKYTTCSSDGASKSLRIIRKFKLTSFNCTNVCNKTILVNELEVTHTSFSKYDALILKSTVLLLSRLERLSFEGKFTKKLKIPVPYLQKIQTHL